MTLPLVDHYADLALARASGARGHRRRIAFLLWWPALAVVIVLAELLHWNGPEAVGVLAVLWALLVLYAVRR
jgi:Flp pilus assembly protein TadB